LAGAFASLAEREREGERHEKKPQRFHKDVDCDWDARRN
jgi:hypothetical protein